MMDTPYNVPSADAAVAAIGKMNPNQGMTQIRQAGASYSKNKRSSNQFVFETSQLNPKTPQSYSADTSTGVYGARSQDAISNPAGI